MTWLWTLLIVLGVAMIVVALWPNIVGLGTKKKLDETDQDTAHREGV
jgi:hypothetical protein